MGGGRKEGRRTGGEKGFWCDMCLAIPARVVGLAGETAEADLHGNRIEVNVALVQGVGVGDWILIHAGFAIQKLEGDDLQSTWALLEDMEKADLEAKS